MGSVPNLELTTTEKQGLAKYEAFIKRYGGPPGVRQFARILEVSPAWAHRLIAQLEYKGAIEKRTVTVRIEQKLPRKKRGTK